MDSTPRNAEEAKAVQEIMGGSTATSEIDLYDSEILEIEKVLRALGQSQGKMMNLEAFRKEIIERFGLAKCGPRGQHGLLVKVTVYEIPEQDPPMFSFDIAITGRTEAHKFDHDQQVHEVTNALLGINEAGVIKADLPAPDSLHTHKH